MRYYFGMSKQITVRLPEEAVAFIDGEVARGREASRASAVARALETQRRRMLALSDVEILKHAADDRDDDLDALAQRAARTELDDLD